MCSQHSQTRFTGVRVRMGGSTGNIRGQGWTGMMRVQGSTCVMGVGSGVQPGSTLTMTDLCCDS